MKTVALPQGVTVYVGGSKWEGEMPEQFCPEHLKPAPAATTSTPAVTPAEPNTHEEPGEAAHDPES